MTHAVDVAVIGTGPGGYVAAIRCAQLAFRSPPSRTTAREVSA